MQVYVVVECAFSLDENRKPRSLSSKAIGAIVADSTVEAATKLGLVSMEVTSNNSYYFVERANSSFFELKDKIIAGHRHFFYAYVLKEPLNILNAPDLILFCRSCPDCGAEMERFGSCFRCTNCSATASCK